MKNFFHGMTFQVYQVQGFDWTKLSKEERVTLHNRFMAMRWAGKEPFTYAFTKSEFDGTAYYGAFAQQYIQQLRRYENTAEDIIEMAYPYEDRHYVYIPASNILALEKREFAQDGLSFPETRERIENILTHTVPYIVTLEPFKHSVSKDQFMQEFLNNPTVRIKADGLKDRIVSDDFIFFNPHFDKNAISRELFNTKILPYLHGIEISSVRMTDLGTRPPTDREDLRHSPVAKLFLSYAEEIRELEVYDSAKRRRRTLKSRYDDKLVLEKPYETPMELTTALLKKLAELPGVQIEVRPENQLQWDLETKGTGE